MNQPTEANSKPNLGLLLAMGDQANTRLRKLLTLYAASSAVASSGVAIWRRGRAEMTFTITVDSRDDLYPDVQAWVMERVPPRRLRSLVAVTRRADSAQPISASGVSESNRLTVFYDGRRTQNVRLGPHRLRVSVEQEDVGGGTRNESGWRRDKVVFTAYGVAARDAVLDVLRDLVRNRNQRQEVRLFGPGWGDWMRVAEMPARHLESVVLRTGQREKLVDDLAAFLAAEPDYVRLGLPWHRGYLLTGPPGTGKTSIAKALAQHFRLDVYFLPLSSIPNDAGLSRLLSTVPPRSLLLLEDIDIVHGARKRDDSEPGVTLSGLLNGLDGVATPHGLISVLTTNDETVLDPALVRPGRVDRTFHLGYLDDDQLARLVDVATKRTLGSSRLPPLDGVALTPGQAIGQVKEHLGDPSATLDALRALIREAQESSVGRCAD